MKKIEYSKEFFMDEMFFRNSLARCGNCPLFGNHNCRLFVRPVKEDDSCSIEDVAKVMDEEKALLVLHKHQVWRRGGGDTMVPPFIIGLAIDVAIRSLRFNKYKEQCKKSFVENWFKNQGHILTD